MLIDYDRPVTWPLEVTTFLEAHRAVLEDWLTDQRFASPHHYDAIIRDLSDVLLPHDILAWHNTRLTRREAAAIGANGMYLPTVETLMMRIEAAERDGEFSAKVAEGFRRKHQAGSATRAGRIWFLFTRPHHDDGIADFLRFWGGESLYAAIDRDPELGPVLRSVGVPSVVEAAIPIADFSDSLGFEMHVAAQYCAWRAKRSYDGVPHDRLLKPLAASSVLRIVSFNDADFADLTGCQHYYDPLTLG